MSILSNFNKSTLPCNTCGHYGECKGTVCYGYKFEDNEKGSSEDKSMCRTCKYQYANDTFRNGQCICVHQQSEFFGIHLFPNSPMGCPQYCGADMQKGSAE